MALMYQLQHEEKLPKDYFVWLPSRSTTRTRASLERPCLQTILGRGLIVLYMKKSQNNSKGRPAT